MWKVCRHSDAHSFLDRAETWLLGKEVEHNVILSVAYLLTGESHFQSPFYFATVEGEAGVCGCILRAPPDGVVFSDLPVTVIPRIVEQLATIYHTFPEAAGPEDVTCEFAKQWQRQSWILHSRHRWYSIAEVLRPKKIADGFLRKGRGSDIALLDKWASTYAREVGTMVDIRMFFRLMVERGLLYLWDDKGPRCVVTASGLTPRAARLSSLFTPPEFRSNGYAANAVAAASQHILDTGRKLCITAANIDDPSSNTIYQGVGYKPGEEYVEIHFI